MHETSCSSSSRTTFSPPRIYSRSGEEMEFRKNKARAEAGKRPTHTPDLIDFSGMGSQAFRRQDCLPTGARHGHQVPAQDTAIKFQPKGT